MHALSSSWLHFRNLQPRRTEWSSGLNLLIGANGSGKTNILEAFHLLGGWGPFQGGRTLSTLLSWSQPEGTARIEGHFSGEEPLSVQALIRSRSSLRLDGKVTKASEIRARLPLLAFQPEDLALVEGSPSRRRAFLDRLCALLFPLYALRLYEYRRALRQRVCLLRQRRDVTLTTKVLAPLGAWIWASRRSAVDLLRLGLEETGDLLPDVLDVEFHRGGSVGLDEPERDFLEAVGRNAPRERALGRVFVGPQRDDLLLRSRGREAALFFSRGHRRRVAVALMLGAAWAVERRLRRKPILLLDEVTAELDERGRDRTFAVLQGSSWQVFAATAGGVAYEWPGSVWVIRQGEVEER